MNTNDRQYKAYGYVRLGLYAVIFVISIFVWTAVGFSLVARLFVFLRLFSYITLGLIFGLALLTAFWLVNFVLVVPTSTSLSRSGFKSSVPYRANGEIQVHFSEIGTIFEFGFGTWVTVRNARTGRHYNFIFGKDTDGYQQLMDTIKDGLNEYRTVK